MIEKASGMVESKIVNVVATAALNQKVDLKELGNCKEVSYNSDSYGGRVAYLKTKVMQGKVSIFSSGKLISVGTKSEEAAAQELEVTKDYLLKKGFISDFALEPIVRNIVFCVDFHKQLSLEDLAFEDHVIYEPEQFPSAIFRILKPHKASVLIFASGKTVITGLTSSNQVETVIERLERLLKEVER